MNTSLKSLLIGSVGGALFFLMDLPLAWMMGSMCLTTVFAVRGTSLSVNPTLRKIMTAILGIMLGSSFSTETLGNLLQWTNGLLLLLVNIVASMLLAYIFFRKVGGFDRITAYFSSAPGGFNVMYEVGEAKGGDGRRIALIHAARVLLLVMTVPLVYRYGVSVQGTSEEISLFGKWEELEGYGWLTLAAVLGYWLGYKLKFPAHHLMGPLLIAAVFELSGLTDVKPPMIFVYAAQLVIGTSIGLRFLGTTIQEIYKVILLSCGSTGIMIALATALSFVTSDYVGISIPGLVLALSPGGLAEMSLVALALGIDVAFVSIMHVIRIAIIIAFVPMLYPLFYRLWIKRRKVT
ncbi:hypothetical protein A9Q83_14825 [Alphaproteobacteria bacterium 46_93_T64]|nr:hypothetical protein A9Q83_14825 [Alphaproteobacteria bacterium 46_93_T64]